MAFHLWHRFGHHLVQCRFRGASGSAFDVAGGVALAAGAFVIAATAHILRMEALRAAGAAGDSDGPARLSPGRSRTARRSWPAITTWRPRALADPLAALGSGLLRGTYTVLFIEFLPVILERVNHFKPVTSRLPTVALQATAARGIVFVVLGVVLSAAPIFARVAVGARADETAPAVVHDLPAGLLLDIGRGGQPGHDDCGIHAQTKAFRRGLELPLLAALGKAAAVVLHLPGCQGGGPGHRRAWPLLFPAQPGGGGVLDGNRAGRHRAGHPLPCCPVCGSDRGCSSRPP